MSQYQQIVSQKLPIASETTWHKKYTNSHNEITFTSGGKNKKILPRKK